MVRDIYEKATGEFEIIVAFDGPPYQQLPDYPNLTAMKLPQRGLKPSVNNAVRVATGKYICKFDSHCAVSEGFDEVLQADMEDNWIVMPRFYVLDAEEWKWQDERFYDYFFLHWPFKDPKNPKFKAGGHWKHRTWQRVESHPHMDETMQMHGSCWFLTKDYFENCLGGMSSVGYDTFGMEPPELCLKTWLGPWDGKVMVNKHCWYAHMHKGGQRRRGYHLSRSRIRGSYTWTVNYWMKNTWEERVHDLDWLVQRFWPVYGWPKNYKEIWDEWLTQQ
jgi:hypothetical protein